MALLEFDDVSVTYRSGGLDVPAVRGVSLSVDAGETLGIAGESGCGKTTLTSTVLRMQPKSAKVSGRVLLDGDDILAMKWGKIRAVRWAKASVVFQGAMHALNPVQRIGDQMAEPITLHDSTVSAAQANTSSAVPGRGMARSSTYPTIGDVGAGMANPSASATANAL